MRKDFADKLPPTYRFLRDDGPFAVSYKKGPVTAKINPAVSAARRTPSFPDAITGSGLAWAFSEQEASRNVKSIAGGTNSNREDQS